MTQRYDVWGDTRNKILVPPAIILHVHVAHQTRFSTSFRTGRDTGDATAGRPQPEVNCSTSARASVWLLRVSTSTVEAAHAVLHWLFVASNTIGIASRSRLFAGGGKGLQIRFGGPTT